jgi:hypothetical protein
MAQSVTQFADSIDPSFQKVFVDTEKEWPTVAERVFHVEDTNLYNTKHSANSGFGLVPEKTHGLAATIDQRYQLYDKTYTQVSYSLAVEVTREMLAFDLTSSFKTLPRALQFSWKQTIETLAANVFNRHINGSYLGADGKVLCANDHPPRPNSSASQDNLGTAGSLTHTTLADGRLNLLKTKNARELQEQRIADRLIIPPDLFEKASIITKSDRKSGSANWDVNIFKGEALDIIQWPFITVTTAYWLQDSRQHDLYIMFSQRPEFNRDKGVSEQIAKWYIFVMCALGFSGWRGIWGNNGA